MNDVGTQPEHSGGNAKPPQVLNPFAKAVAPGLSAAADAESQRAVAEVQAAIMLAKRFPRDQLAATERILQACCRPSLAEQAVYSYTRGGTEVTGPSIRMAEAIAQAWGNMQFGIRELAQGAGQSTVEAFAWDVETNTRQVKVFEVPHVRDTKQGRKVLTDARDIYEMVANQGARRLRACILGVIPGDVVDAALKQCDETLKANVKVTPESIKALVEAFGEFGVTGEAIVKKLGHKLEAISPGEVVRLRKIYRAIKDGFTTAEAEFTDVVAGGKGGGTRPGQVATAVIQPENTPERIKLIAALEEAANKGSMELSAAWGELGAASRKLVGDEINRLKEIADKVTAADSTRAEEEAGRE